MSKTVLICQLLFSFKEKIPATSKVYPMIAIYYACTIIQVSLAMGMSTVMLCFYHKRPCTTPIPKWVKVRNRSWHNDVTLGSYQVTSLWIRSITLTWVHLPECSNGSCVTIIAQSLVCMLLHYAKYQHSRTTGMQTYRSGLDGRVLRGLENAGAEMILQ